MDQDVVGYEIGVVARLPQEKKMADRTGLEPATSGVTGRHSNQLNYRSAKWWV